MTPRIWWLVLWSRILGDLARRSVVASGRAKRRLRLARQQRQMRPTRYDETYFDGVAWLDAEDGERWN